MSFPDLPAGTVFVTVGTDHHRFDRLVDWVERWAGGGTGRSVLVQHGHSRPARIGVNRSMLTIDEMREAFRLCSVVVTGGGPGTIMDARAEGCLPVVVARQAARSEAVDDHQRAFAGRLAAEGKVLLAEDEAGLARLLDRAEREPRAFSFDPRAEPAPAGLARIPTLLDALVGRAPAPALEDVARRLSA